METITPLAQRLKLRINTSFPRFDYENMVEEVVSHRGVVLICWQREYIPMIAKHILKAERITPSIWPEDCFDIAWVFDLDRRSSRYRFKQVAQKLLAGDRVTPIR